MALSRLSLCQTQSALAYHGEDKSDKWQRISKGPHLTVEWPRGIKPTVECRINTKNSREYCSNMNSAKKSESSIVCWWGGTYDWDDKISNLVVSRKFVFFISTMRSQVETNIASQHRICLTLRCSLSCNGLCSIAAYVARKILRYVKVRNTVCEGEEGCGRLWWAK